MRRICVKEQQEGCYAALTTAKFEKLPAYWRGLKDFSPKFVLPSTSYASVVAALFYSHRGTLHRLAIHHARAGLGIPFQANAQAFAAGGIDPLPGAIDTPFAEVSVNGGPPGEVVGQQSPLAAALQEVEDGVLRISRRSSVLGRPNPSGAGKWGSM